MAKKKARKTKRPRRAGAAKRPEPDSPAAGATRGRAAKPPVALEDDRARKAAAVADGPHAPRPPLADRMRPASMDEFVGQMKLVGSGTLVRRALETGKLTSIILWGPPGSGKTTLARIIATASGAHFASFSAVLSGVAEVRRIVAEARARLDGGKGPTFLFVDEIHRFNKAQQDAFLPHVEAGTVTLIGATTENPSFELTSPLLSRCRVLVLEPLSPADVRAILDRALADADRGLAGLRPNVEEDALDFMVNFSNGDARQALNALELSVTAGKLDARGGRRVTRAVAEEAMQRKAILYDKSGEEHYNIISALHKSLRGSDCQAALYWLRRMLEGGEDPLYILRRLVRFAAEDVGLADPGALKLALAAKEAYEFVGLPEGDLFLAEITAYLAAAPKSNSLYAAMNEIRRDMREREAPPVPLHIRNAPTRLMRELGYGKGYEYDHDRPGHVSGQEYLPDALRGRVFYRPGEYGFEREMRKRIAYWERMRRRARGGQAPPGDMAGAAAAEKAAEAESPARPASAPPEPQREDPGPPPDTERDGEPPLA